MEKRMQARLLIDEINRNYGTKLHLRKDEDFPEMYNVFDGGRIVYYSQGDDDLLNYVKRFHDELTAFKC